MPRMQATTDAFGAFVSELFSGDKYYGKLHHTKYP